MADTFDLLSPLVMPPDLNEKSGEQRDYYQQVLRGLKTHPGQKVIEHIYDYNIELLENQLHTGEFKEVKDLDVCRMKLNLLKNVRGLIRQLVDRMDVSEQDEEFSNPEYIERGMSTPEESIY